MDFQDNIEAESRARRMQRVKKMQEEKQRQLMLRQKISQAAPFIVAVVLFILVVWAGIGLIGRRTDSKGEDIGKQEQEGTELEDKSIAVSDSNVVAGDSGDRVCPYSSLYGRHGKPKALSGEGNEGYV